MRLYFVCSGAVYSGVDPNVVVKAYSEGIEKGFDRLAGYLFRCDKLNHQNKNPLTDDDLQDRCYALIHKLQNHEFAKPFLEPVNLSEVKNYTKIVKNPMDLGTVENMLNNNQFVKPDGKFDIQQFYDTVLYYSFIKIG